MRTCGNDLFYFISVQYLNILVCHHLEHEFIACTPCRIACTHFFFSQNGVFDTYFFKYGNKGFGDLLCTLIKTTGTAYPKQYFRLFALC